MIKYVQINEHHLEQLYEAYSKLRYPFKSKRDEAWAAIDRVARLYQIGNVTSVPGPCHDDMARFTIGISGYTVYLYT